MDGVDRRRVGESMDGYSHHENSIINRIMLGFRPIAPKPVNRTEPSSSACAFQQESKSLKVSSGKRSKRKYVRVSKNKQTKKNSKRLAQDDKANEFTKTILTLQLLPVKSCDDGISKELDKKALKHVQDSSSSSMLIDFVNPRMADLVSGDRTAEMIKIVESWVIVECVTDTCMDVRGLGCTDKEKMNNLEKDTCPGFLSDSSNKIMWMNEAYKKFVSHEGDNSKPEVAACLVVKESLPFMYLAFSCRVKLQYYTWGMEKKCSMTMPCDVWRMDFGGFAWRLDVRAALSLGP